MDKDLLELSVLKAFEYHEGQLRKFSDELYVNHCLRVASLTGDYTDDDALIAAAVLHDTVEDTTLTIHDIKSLFGDRVSSLVYELTNDEVLLNAVGKRKYIRDKFQTLSLDAFLIKCLDRLDNLTGLINSKASLKFVKTYVSDTDYLLETIDRDDLLSVHKELLYNLAFINNYVALTILR